jgi:hypothetical protein
MLAAPLRPQDASWSWDGGFLLGREDAVGRAVRDAGVGGVKAGGWAGLALIAAVAGAVSGVAEALGRQLVVVGVRTRADALCAQTSAHWTTTSRCLSSPARPSGPSSSSCPTSPKRPAPATRYTRYNTHRTALRRPCYIHGHRDARIPARHVRRTRSAPIMPEPFGRSSCPS